MLDEVAHGRHVAFASHRVGLGSPRGSTITFASAVRHIQVVLVTRISPAAPLLTGCGESSRRITHALSVAGNRDHVTMRCPEGVGSLRLGSGGRGCHIGAHGDALLRRREARKSISRGEGAGRGEQAHSEAIFSI